MSSKSGSSLFYKLPGPATFVETRPLQCTTCGDKRFYQQPDFKRSLGLSLIVIASLSTFVLLYYNASWLVTWSPMFIVLIIDRTLNALMPSALICYQCSHIYRGLSKDQIKDVEAFDLEVHDRYQYSERQGS